MASPQSIDEIMQRIRAQVQERQGSGAMPKAAGVGDSDKQDAGQLLERIRQQLKGTQEPAAAAAVKSSSAPELKLHDLHRLQDEVRTCLSTHGQVGQLNPRSPGLLNNAIQFVKKVMRRSLTWYTRPLHLFQGAVVRALQQVNAILQNHDQALRGLSQELNNQVTVLQQLPTEERVQALQAASVRLEHKIEDKTSALSGKLDTSLSAYSQRIASMTDELEALRSQMRRVQDEMHESAIQRRGSERDVRRLTYAIESGKFPLPVAQASATPAMFPSEVKKEFEFDYFLFEDRYRGDEADIRNRQKDYLEYFRGRENVIDIGCGRGEFLELLRDNNIRARGVELGTDQYLLCREKGLDVVQQDLFAFLESLPDESLGGIFSAQVIEHLTASDQLRYVALAHRKTKTGSPVIFETINPECVYALVRNFFLDPTHIRPVHPETLKFAMESAEFKNVELRFSGPVNDKRIPALQLDGSPENMQRFNRAVEQLNDLIYGYQDYAAIGWRGPGPPSTPDGKA